jgi:hypothetical protein
MTKCSLNEYCSNIKISLHLGLRWSKGKKRKEAEEMDTKFMDLIPKIEVIL